MKYMCYAVNVILSFVKYKVYYYLRAIPLVPVIIALVYVCRLCKWNLQRKGVYAVGDTWEWAFRVWCSDAADRIWASLRCAPNPYTLILKA